jgi:hypothetical protein
LAVALLARLTTRLSHITSSNRQQCNICMLTQQSKQCHETSQRACIVHLQSIFKYHQSQTTICHPCLSSVHPSQSTLIDCVRRSVGNSSGSLLLATGGGYSQLEFPCTCNSTTSNPWLPRLPAWH